MKITLNYWMVNWQQIRALEQLGYTVTIKYSGVTWVRK